MANNNPSGSGATPQRWFPLESNPTLINNYLSTLGFQSPSSMIDHHFVDVYSIDDWALQMIPQPVAAVLLLYPLTEKQLQAEQQEQQQATNAKKENDNEDNVWFIKQRIGNACGTIGLLHTVMNLESQQQQQQQQQQNQQQSSSSWFRSNSWLEQFYQQSKSKTPLERAELLESNKDIAQHHDQATTSSDNQTNRGNLDDDLITHFVALICHENTLYELDGRKPHPIPHGPTTPETLLYDACQLVKSHFMARDPTELRFTITALAPNMPGED